MSEGEPARAEQAPAWEGVQLSWLVTLLGQFHPQAPSCASEFCSFSNPGSYIQIPKIFLFTQYQETQSLPALTSSRKPINLSIWALFGREQDVDSPNQNSALVSICPRSCLRARSFVPRLESMPYPSPSRSSPGFAPKPIKCTLIFHSAQKRPSWFWQKKSFMYGDETLFIQGCALGPWDGVDWISV